MDVRAVQQMPATMEEMWKIIQQQQKEIEALKAKAGQSEAAQKEVKEEVKELKASAQAASDKAPSAPAAKTEAERKTDILASEVEKLKTMLVIPEEPEYKSRYGLGPAASKVYGISKGLSIGGYGEAFYQNIAEGDHEVIGGKASKRDDNADLLRLVLYAGYRFTDKILFNSEIEFEHASTSANLNNKSGEVSVEFANVDFFLDPMANIRAGLVLVPMGFINEIHEPPFFHGTIRPEVETKIIPSTWRELGVGLFGELLPGLQYRVYGVSGLDARGFGAEDALRGGRQKGSRVTAENLAVTGRLDYTPAFVPGLLVGGSFWTGDSAQDRTFNKQKADVFTQLYEGHVQYRYRGLELRALGAWGSIGDAELLALDKAKGKAGSLAPVGEEFYGWYAEAAYDVMPWLIPGSAQYLAPFFRYEQFDTIAEAPEGFLDDESRDRQVFQGGLSYKPIPNVVIKADYRNIDAEAGKRADEFNLGLGFIF